MRRALAVAEHADPEAEQHVVGRRRAVLPQDVWDRRPVVVRDADGDPLVDPEARAELPDAKGKGKGEQAGKRGGGRGGRLQAARAGGFGTRVATVLEPATV